MAFTGALLGRELVPHDMRKRSGGQLACPHRSGPRHHITRQRCFHHGRSR